jgi:hypothetical protein
MPRDDRVANQTLWHCGILSVQLGRFPIAILWNRLLYRSVDTSQNLSRLRLDAALEP